MKRINLNMRRILTPATITFVLLFIGMQFVPVGTKQRNSTSVGALKKEPRSTRWSLLKTGEYLVDARSNAGVTTTI